MVAPDVVGREPERVAVDPRTEHRAPALLIVALYLTALGGRFTLDRIGITTLGEFDLRLAGCVVLLLLAVGWRLHPQRVGVRFVLAPSTRVALILFGLLALSALWAESGARVGELLVDLAVLVVLVLVTAILTAPDPARMWRILLWCSFVAGLVYAIGGVLGGETTVQGRTSFLGGGPNVYVRVVCLGILAAIALAVVYRRYLLMIAIPLMVVAAFVSGSRGGLIAAVVTVAAFLVVSRRRLSVRRLWVLLTLTAAGILVAFALLDDRTLDLLQRRYVADVAGAAGFSGRPALFTEALSLFTENPLFGAGLDGFYVTYGISFGPDYAHNLVLDLAATAGLTALALVAVYLVMVSREIRAVGSLQNEQVALLLGALYVAAASMFSGDLYDSRFIWILLVAALTPWTPMPTARSSGPVVAAGSRS